MMSNSSAVSDLSICAVLSNAVVLVVEDQIYQSNESNNVAYQDVGSSTVDRNLSSSSPRAGRNTCFPFMSYPTWGRSSYQCIGTLPTRLGGYQMCSEFHRSGEKSKIQYILCGRIRVVVWFNLGVYTLRLASDFRYYRLRFRKNMKVRIGV